MNKGISLSTNALVLLAIAFIVLLSMLALMSGIIPGTNATLRCHADLRSGCNSFVAAGGCDKNSVLDPRLHVADATADCALGIDCLADVAKCEDDIIKACCGKPRTP